MAWRMGKAEVELDRSEDACKGGWQRVGGGQEKRWKKGIVKGEGEEGGREEEPERWGDGSAGPTADAML